MTPNSSNPKLLTLPKELRDIIYDFTFSSVAGRSHFRSHDNTPARCNAGLLLTCRQLHAETITMYYETSIFFATPGGIMWYAELPAKYRELVREVRVWTIDWEWENGFCRARNVERLGHGICAITHSLIRGDLLKTYFDDGKPSFEVIADYDSDQWWWVMPYCDEGAYAAS